MCVSCLDALSHAYWNADVICHKTKSERSNRRFEELDTACNNAVVGMYYCHECEVEGGNRCVGGMIDFRRRTASRIVLSYIGK